MSFGISGKCNNRCVEGKLERILHKDQCRLASPSLYHTCLHTCWGRWGLGAEAQALEVRPQREDWNWLPWRQSGGASTTQLKESRKIPGLARETRDHCCGVLEKSRPAWDYLTQCAHRRQGTDSKGPEVGQAADAVSNPRSGHDAAKTATKLWAGAGHCLHFPWRLYSWHCWGTHNIRASSPGRAHDWLQAMATSCRPLPLQALTAHSNFICCIPPSPWPQWVSEL